MPQYDIYHDAVKRALLKDGWNITHDPFTLRYGRKRVYADLGAERLISAEKGNEKIVVEVKSFVGASDVRELEQAVGQYILYRQLLNNDEPERVLYVAVTTHAFKNIFEEGLGELFITREILQVVVFEPKEEVIVKWIPERHTKK